MVYIDNANVERFGRQWSHLVADSLDELHAFAEFLAVPRRWFHANAKYPHYDVTAPYRHKALSMGAQPASRRQLLVSARALRIELTTVHRSRNATQLALFD